MADRIVTATACAGSVFIVAGITTKLVAQTQARHNLAPTASAALGRLITGAALLGASLSEAQRLSLQVLGEGPLRSLVADVALTGAKQIGVRAYAHVPEVDLPLNEQGKINVSGAVGSGHLHVTRSYEVGQPYVGIVKLVSGEIGEDIAAYLMVSEQIPSVVALGVLLHSNGILAAGGAIAQVMPGADETTIDALEKHAAELPPFTTQIADGAMPEDLARALAGTLDVRMHESYTVHYACHCTREKVEFALMSLGRDDLEKLTQEQEETEAVCEFCKKRYLFTRSEVASLITRLDAKDPWVL